MNFLSKKERFVRACDTLRSLMRDDEAASNGISRFHLGFIAMAEISGTII